MNRLLAVILTITLVAPGAQAFDWFGGRLSIGGGYGTAKPKLPDSYQDDFEQGRMWTARLNYFLNDNFSIVASYSDLQPKDRATGQRMKLRPILGSLRFNLFHNLPFTPYVTVGAGVSINRKERATGPAVLWEKFALQGGGGLEFFVNQGTSFAAEANYHEFNGEGSVVPYRLVSLVGLVNIYFGDGPATKRARAEADAKRLEADRLAGEVRQALQLAADAQRAAADAATAKAEADRKVQEMQIRAQQAQQEIDKIQQMVAQKAIKPVNFKTGQALLLVESYPTLDMVAKVARPYPELKLRVEGHTDSQGGDAYNMKLSQARADAVREYLIGAPALPAKQVVAAGFGETRPVAANDTVEGRARNRRVEFIFFIP